MTSDFRKSFPFFDLYFLLRKIRSALHGIEYTWCCSNIILLNVQKLVKKIIIQKDSILLLNINILIKKLKYFSQSINLREKDSKTPYFRRL